MAAPRPQVQSRAFTLPPNVPYDGIAHAIRSVLTPHLTMSLPYAIKVPETMLYCCIKQILCVLYHQTITYWILNTHSLNFKQLFIPRQKCVLHNAIDLIRWTSRAANNLLEKETKVVHPQNELRLNIKSTTAHSRNSMLPSMSLVIVVIELVVI